MRELIQYTKNERLTQTLTNKYNSINESLLTFFSKWKHDLLLEQQVKQLIENSELKETHYISDLNHIKNVDYTYQDWFSVEISFMSREDKTKTYEKIKNKKMLEVMDQVQNEILSNMTYYYTNSVKEKLMYLKMDYKTNQVIKNKIIVSKYGHAEFEKLFLLLGSQMTSTFDKKKNGNVHIILSSEDKEIITDLLQSLRRI